MEEKNGIETETHVPLWAGGSDVFDPAQCFLPSKEAEDPRRAQDSGTRLVTHQAHPPCSSQCPLHGTLAMIPPRGRQT
jgi:hypothetical protein